MPTEKIIPKRTKEGDFIHQTQKMAKDEGHRNVSISWFDKTISIEDELERLIATRDQRYHISTSLERITPVELGGRCVLRVRDLCLNLDAYSAGQLGSMLSIGAEYPKKMIKSYQKGAAEMLVLAYEHALRTAIFHKDIVLKIEREDENDTLRGIVCAGSSIFANDWLLGVIQRAIPGGRLSHYRGDDYTMLANVLIPDTIREEADSEYGALISVSNSEILKCRFRLLPSVFRAICFNGNIWGRTDGQAFTVNRRAKEDLVQLEKEIAQNINDQIPLSISALDSLLATRSYTTSVSIKPILAQVARQYHLSKRLSLAVLDAWHVENQNTPDLGHTLFGVVNAVTRAGQALDDKTWVRCDELGGTLAQISNTDWDELVSLASRLTAKQVEARFADWSLAG